MIRITLDKKKHIRCHKNVFKKVLNIDVNNVITILFFFFVKL